MKGNFLFALAVLFLMLFTASTLQAGYSIDPWGSRTWTGPGRPPHWSPKSTRPDKSVAPGKLFERERRYRQSRESDGRSGYRNNRHKRRYYHRYRQPAYIYYQKPRVEKVIIERERQIPVYIPVQKKPARLKCGGNTTTRYDEKTGGMIIEYVTGARDC
jgi:hypothetical protein